MTTLALIPARGGSKGFPGKNLATLGGLSLLGHAVRLAQLCAGIDRVVVSTDSEQIAAEAAGLGAEVPFLRPAALAADDTPMWPVVAHALREAGEDVETVVLLQPTTPFRLPADVEAALERLAETTGADGVVGVAVPAANPIWVAVVEEGGWMHRLWDDAARATARQQLPEVLQITGALYVWRGAFARADVDRWVDGRHLVQRMEPWSAVDIDEPWHLALAESLLASGAVRLPWLEGDA